MSPNVERIFEELQATADGRKVLEMAAAQGQMAAVERLEHFLGGLKSAAIGEVRLLPKSEQMSDNERLLAQLRDLLNSLVKDIAATKSQLDAITQLAHEREVSGYSSVEDQLRAVVQDTETATSQILDALEGISDAVALVRKDPAQSETLLDRIDALATHALTACSFQDITAQRIAKIVEFLRTVDEKVAALDDLANGNHLQRPVRREHTFDQRAPASDYSRDVQASKGLLEGPALKNDDASRVLTQHGIDALLIKGGREGAR